MACMPPRSIAPDEVIARIPRTLVLQGTSKVESRRLGKGWMGCRAERGCAHRCSWRGRYANQVVDQGMAGWRMGFRPDGSWTAGHPVWLRTT